MKTCFYIGDMFQMWQQIGKAPPTFHAPAAWRGTLSTCCAAVGAGDDSSTGCLPTAAVCMRPSATCLLPPIFATPHWSVSTEHHTAERQIFKPQFKSFSKLEELSVEEQEDLDLFDCDRRVEEARQQHHLRGPHARCSDNEESQSCWRRA